MTNIKLEKYGVNHYIKTVEWLNSKEIKNSFGIVKDIDLLGHTNWVEKSSNIIIKAVYVDEIYIGNILLHIDNNHESGFFQIYFGEARSRGKGYAKKAIILALNEFFKEYKLNRIWLKVFSDNDLAIHLYNSIGFVKEGLERESFKEKDKYRNQLVYSILRKEWE